MPSPRDPARDPSSVGTRAPTSSRASPTSDPILFSPLPAAPFPGRPRRWLHRQVPREPRRRPLRPSASLRRRSGGLHRAPRHGPGRAQLRRGPSGRRLRALHRRRRRVLPRRRTRPRDHARGRDGVFHVRVRHLTPTTAYPEVRITLRRVHPDVGLARRRGRVRRVERRVRRQDPRAMGRREDRRVDSLPRRRRRREDPPTGRARHRPRRRASRLAHRDSPSNPKTRAAAKRKPPARRTRAFPPPSSTSSSARVARRRR